MTVHADQVYRDVSNVALRYDFFRPEVAGSVAVIVAVHGGGWISGDKEDFRDIAFPFVRHGFAVAIPNYRLAPLHPFPAAVEDLEAFMVYLRDNAKEFGIDPDKVGAMGLSAGGHLVSLLACSSNLEARPNAVVDVCGITDLTDPYEKLDPISWGFVDHFLPFDWASEPEKFEAASPLEQVVKGMPPMLVIHGDADDVVRVEQSDAFVEKLQQEEVRVRYLRLEGEDHAFSGGSWGLIEGEAIEYFHRELR